MPRTLCCALLLLLLGCESPTGSVGRIPLEFRFGENRQAVHPLFFTSTGEGTLLVAGGLLTPCEPYEATAAARLEGDELVLRVTGDNKGDCPMDVVSTTLYSIRLPDLPAGSYRLRVVHSWKDVGWPAITAYNAEVRVR